MFYWYLWDLKGYWTCITICHIINQTFKNVDHTVIVKMKILLTQDI